MQLAISRGLFVYLDDEDYPLVAGKTWYALPGKRGNHYASNPGPPSLLMHRVITGAAPGTRVDHEDGDGLNNRRSNLRVATNAQNMWNTGPRVDNRSGYKGVYADARRGTWCFAVAVNGRRHYGTGFTSVESAHAAAQAFRATHHGDFARTERH